MTKISKQVAAVFDWDKTLSPRYMPYIIFDHFDVDERKFWAEANDPARGFKCPEVSFMAHLSHCAKPGECMDGLDRDLMIDLGQGLPVYPGVKEMFTALKEMGVEIYIISSGLQELLLEHPIAQMATKVFASSYVDDKLSWPSEIVSPIDKIRALYEISKGCHIYDIHPTAEVPDHLRRIPFKNIIYTGDGPSDSYAFGKVIKSGGLTVGVWDPEVPAGFDQIDRMRRSGLLSFIGRADFDPVESSTGFWICNKALHLISLGEAEACQEEMEAIKRLKDEKPTFVHPWSLRRMG